MLSCARAKRVEGSTSQEYALDFLDSSTPRLRRSAQNDNTEDSAEDSVLLCSRFALSVSLRSPAPPEGEPRVFRVAFPFEGKVVREAQRNETDEVVIKLFAKHLIKRLILAVPPHQSCLHFVPSSRLPLAGEALRSDFLFPVLGRICPPAAARYACDVICAFGTRDSRTFASKKDRIAPVFSFSFFTSRYRSRGFRG